MTQHPLFVKYKRQWLHEVTGYSLGLLSRVATGRVPLSRSFIERVSHKLQQSEQELFLLDNPVDIEQNRLGQWLKNRCEHLTLRQAAAKTGLSHATIEEIIRGVHHPSPGSIRKLVTAFGGSSKEQLVLEDTLLEAAGYRTPRLEEDLNQLLARLIDRVGDFNNQQLTVMVRFAEFLAEIEAEREEGK
ncbi:hypothetical protein ES708_07639 [subsurface metagenome]